MSVAICIDGVAMRRARDDGALVHIWHHDAAEDWHQGNAEATQRMAAASPGVCIAAAAGRRRGRPSQAGSLVYCFASHTRFQLGPHPWPIVVSSVSESLSMSRAGSGCSLGPGVLPHVSLPHRSCGTALCLYRVFV
jgi:hypothetical protein